MTNKAHDAMVERGVGAFLNYMNNVQPNPPVSGAVRAIHAALTPANLALLVAELSEHDQIIFMAKVHEQRTERRGRTRTDSDG